MDSRMANKNYRVLGSGDGTEDGNCNITAGYVGATTGSHSSIPY